MIVDFSFASENLHIRYKVAFLSCIIHYFSLDGSDQARAIYWLEVFVLFERRVKVNEIDAAISEILAVSQYFQVVAEVKDIGIHSSPCPVMSLNPT